MSLYKEAYPFINFIGWENIANVLIEKARYCSMIPRNHSNDLDMYNECIRQLEFIEWLRTELGVPNVIKDYVRDFRFEKDYDQYIIPPLRNYFNIHNDRKYTSRIENYSYVNGEEFRLNSEARISLLTENFIKIVNNDYFLQKLQTPDYQDKYFQINTKLFEIIKKDRDYWTGNYRTIQKVGQDFQYLLSCANKLKESSFKIEQTLTCPSLKKPIHINCSLHIDYDTWRSFDDNTSEYEDDEDTSEYEDDEDTSGYKGTREEHSGYVIFLSLSIDEKTLENARSQIASLIQKL